MSDKEIILKPINRVVQPTDAEIQLQPITDDSIGYAAPVAQTTDETVDTSGVNWWGFLGGLVGVGGLVAIGLGGDSGGDSSVASDKMPTNTDTSHTTPSTQASTVESTVIRAYYLNQDTARFSGSLNNPFDTGSLVLG